MGMSNGLRLPNSQMPKKGEMEQKRGSKTGSKHKITCREHKYAWDICNRTWLQNLDEGPPNAPL